MRGHAMRSRVLYERDGRRSYALIFEIGDEVMAGLRGFAREHDLDGARFSAIGAFRDAKLAYWNWDTKEYEPHAVDEQVEVAAMQGNIAQAPDGDEPKVHAHVVIGGRDGSARAGHLLEAHVRPTLEVMIEESPDSLRRRRDDATGLDLIRP